MKLTIFYSWQSDLPNNKNRGLIGDCLEKAAKNIYKKNKYITEYIIDSDSRDETGTPDIVKNIFSKIDVCDIFVADISIINKGSSERKTSNPNVLIELGYATSVIGWENIICVFNDDYGKKEELPFDIRFRKPLSYNTADKTQGKKYLTSQLEQGMQNIIEKRLNDKTYYNDIKREVDLGLQAVLFDILKMLYFMKSDHRLELLNYPKLLHNSQEDIECLLKDAELLGFQLFKNTDVAINDLTQFFNDSVKISFLNEKEKSTIAKIIMSLNRLKKILYSENVFDEIGESTKYIIVSAHEVNDQNPKDSFILLEKIDNEKGIVKDSGSFNQTAVQKATIIYTIKPRYLKTIAFVIYNIIVLINDWIRNTGGQFIFNSRLLEEKHVTNRYTLKNK